MTEDVVAYFNQQTGMNLTPVFDQYLRHTALPELELKWDEAEGTVSYRWKADEPAFRCRSAPERKNHWQIAPAHRRVADAEDAAQERRIRSRDRSLLRHRQ